MVAAVDGFDGLGTTMTESPTLRLATLSRVCPLSTRAEGPSA